jgi:hypothetical protein
MRRKILAEVVEREMHTATWLRQMPEALGLRADDPGAAGLLARAFEQTFHEVRQRVFLLLGLAHDPASIERIHIALLRGGSEAHSYALELLEHLLDAKEARLIGPLLDPMASPVSAAGSGLQTPAWRSALAAIAVRAGAEEAPWLASCTLYLMGEVRDAAFIPTLEALAGSEHPMVRETAEWALRRAQAVPSAADAA